MVLSSRIITQCTLASSSIYPYSTVYHFVHLYTQDIHIIVAMRDFPAPKSVGPGQIKNQPKLVPLYKFRSPS